jgi:hypothetical protein
LNSFAQETRTSLGFSLHPNVSSLLYRNDGSFSDADVELIESGTHSKLGLSGNFFFQYKLTDKLFVTWGLGIQNYSSRATYYSQSNIEHPEITRETEYMQYYIQFNTSLKYFVFKSLYATAGVGVDLLAEQRARRTETCPWCYYLYQGDDYSRIYNEAIIPAFVGVGYELKLSDRWNLMTELFGSMSLTDALMTTVFTDQVQNFPQALLKPHLQQRPFQLGCKIGIIRSF